MPLAEKIRDGGERAGAIPLFDAHCDTLTSLLEQGGALRENDFQVDLTRLSRFSPSAQVFAVWNGRYAEKAALLRAELAKNADRAVFCRTPAEARAAAAAGRTAAFLSVEGMEQLDCSADALRLARRRDGVLMVNLCWNHDNALCGAAMDGGGGLTPAGRAFVPAAQALGVAVDLSHASERTFWDALEVSRKPLLASHSDSAALCADFPRNLTDAQFLALVRCGGGAGVNLCPDFLGLTRDSGAVCAHLEHYLSLGGEKAVFLGADLDGIDETPRDIAGVQDMGRVWEEMLRRNWSEDLVRDIFWNNLLDILERAA